MYILTQLNKCLSKVPQTLCKCIHTTSTLTTFWERDVKSGYGEKGEKLSTTEMIREGLKELKGEIKLWKEEMKETFEFDPVMVFRPGETDVVWKFSGEDSLKDWVATSDKDNNEGYSSCSLSINKQGKGLFSGELVTRVPKDGRIKRAGYCNIRTLTARVSFIRYYNSIEILL